MFTNPSAGDMLAAVRQSLVAEIRPELQSDRARQLLANIDAMLASVQQRIPLEQQWMAEECNRMSAILSECAQALAAEPGATASALRESVRRLGQRPSFAPLPPFDEINRVYREISEVFTEVVGYLNELDGEGAAGVPVLLTRARAYLHLRAQRDMAALYTIVAPPRKKEPAAEAAQPVTAAVLIRQLTQYMTALLLPGAITAGAQLELDRHFGNGPRRVDELARLTETDAATLYRLLRALATLEFLTEGEDGSFALTPLGEQLRFARMGMVGEPAHRAWGELRSTLRTGRPAFDEIYGMSFYEYLGQQPEVEAIFNEWNTETASLWLPPTIAACDFAGARTLVDVGGGEGTFLAAALRANPGLRGILLDLPDAVASAPSILEAAGVTDRCTVVGGSFFDAVPTGGDVYTIVRILFNWDDARATAILRTVRRAIGEAGRLLVIEGLLPPLGHPQRATAAFNDLNLLVMMGGRQRTEAEFRALFRVAGFDLTSLTQIEDVWHVIEGRPV